MFIYSYCNVYVFLLICMFCSVYSLSLHSMYCFMCKCVMYCCHRVSTHLRSINISYHISYITEGTYGYQQDMENCLEWKRGSGILLVTEGVT